MTRDQLEHAIRAACHVAEDDELLIFGSQAVLGSHPDAPEDLRASIEVDVQPLNKPEAADRIDGALGELSPFNETHGFYVQGVPIDAATLPLGWENRTIPVNTPQTNGNTGHCLDCYDLAASKLFAYRDKDKEFVRILLTEGLCDGDLLLERIGQLPIEEKRRQPLVQWLTLTLEEV